MDWDDYGDDGYMAMHDEVDDIMDTNGQRMTRKLFQNAWKRVKAWENVDEEEKGDGKKKGK